MSSVAVGRLRYMATLEERSEKLDDSTGQVELSWKQYRYCPAGVRDASGREITRGGSQEAIVDSVVTIRYPGDPFSRIPQPTDRVKIKEPNGYERILNVNYVKRRDDAARVLELFCKEESAG